MRECQVIENARSFIHKLFQGNFGGHDEEHTLRVYLNAMRIAATEGPCDQFLVAMGALLHDVDDYKLFNTKDNENARNFLKDNGVEDEKIEQICQIINSVSFSKNRDTRPATLEGQIVQDADRLDAIGAIGIARTFAFGGEHGRPLSSTVEHFHEKLLLLKDMMNTDTARAMAQKRHEFMESYLENLRQETGLY